MEAIALFGAGEAEQTVQYIQEIMSTFWSSVTIESVFLITVHSGVRRLDKGL